MISITDDAHVAALTALAEAGIDPDVQELLVAGNPSRGIAPGALAKAIDAAIPTTSRMRRLSELKECVKGILGAEMSDNERRDDALRLIEIVQSSFDARERAAVVVPEGWQLVPKIATEEMRLAAHDGPLLAGEHAMNESNREWLGDMYASMLEAAPALPAEMPPRTTEIATTTPFAIRLEWEERFGRKNLYDQWNACTPLGDYHIMKMAHEFGWILDGRTGWNSTSSLDEAKDAAQADFEARVRSIIRPALLGRADLHVQEATTTATCQTGDAE